MRFRSFVFLLLCLGVAACNRNPLEVIVSRCPAVAVVGDAGVVTRFSGAGRDTDDVAYTATILDVRSSCVEGSSVVNMVDFQIGVNAGPANEAEDLTLDYFVVVLRDNNQIVSKSVYSTTVTFDRFGIGRARETIEQVIPTVEQARRYNYEILLGFQTDPADIVYNMQR